MLPNDSFVLVGRLDLRDRNGASIGEQAAKDEHASFLAEATGRVNGLGAAVPAKIVAVPATAIYRVIDVIYIL